MILRNIAVFLPAITEADPKQSSRPKCDLCLMLLVSFPGQMLFRVKESVHAPGAIRVVLHREAEQEQTQQANRDDQPHARARYEEHHEADGREQHRGAVVRFQKNQPDHRPDDHAGPEDSLDDGRLPHQRHVPSEAFHVGGEDNEERELREFRGLEHHEVQVQPPPGPAAADADEGNQHRNEQPDGECEDRPGDAALLKSPVVEKGDEAAGDNAQRFPEHLLVKVARTGGRAAEHDRAQREQRRHAEHKDCGRQFHDRVRTIQSRTPG